MKSMNIIYLDTLFLVNFVCDYILLLCTARVSGAEIRRGQILLASVLGGLYACLCTFSEIPWVRSPIIQCVCSTLLCIAAFGQEARMLRCIISFLCISAMVGGVLSALSISIHETIFLPMNFKIIFPVFAIVCGILSLLLRRFPQLQRKQLHQITVTMNDRTIQFRAMRDTGNELYDPITNLPVLICETTILRQLFPNLDMSANDPYILFFTLSETDLFKNRMKLIPYKTISETGILLGFKPDRVQIDDREEHCIVAFSPTQFSPTAPYQAII